MIEGLDLDAVYPALPELLLAVGAMALLMVGALRGDARRAGIERVLPWCCSSSPSLLVVVGMPGERIVAFGGSFVVDAFGAGSQAAGAGRLGRRRSCCRSNSCKRPGAPANSNTRC